MTINPHRARRILLSALFAASCGGDHTSPSSNNNGILPPPNAKAEFSVIPVDISGGGTLTPLGSLNPPGHVLPTDHVYFYPVDFTHPPSTPSTLVRTVYAPAAGTVNFMIQPVGTDWKIQFITTSTFSYYVDHIIPRADLTLGTIVQAGDSIGVTNPGGTLDLGVVDYTKTLSFVNPVRYGDETLHTQSPWKYFVEPLRSQLYARIRRAPTAADKDGHIDFDVAGRLVGNWFHSSLTPGYGNEGPDGWPKTIAFVFDYYDPQQVRISIGGTVAPAGIWGIEPSAPRPADVSVASGKVSYRLMYSESTTVQYGLMLVQMLTDSQIKIEVFVGDTAATAEFDTNAHIYNR